MSCLVVPPPVLRIPHGHQLQKCYQRPASEHNPAMSPLRSLQSTCHCAATSYRVQLDWEVSIVFVMVTQLPVFGIERVNHIEVVVEGYLIGVLTGRVSKSSRDELGVLLVRHRRGGGVRVGHCCRCTFLCWIALDLLWFCNIWLPNDHICIFHSGTEAIRKIGPSHNNSIKNDVVVCNIVVHRDTATIREC